MLLEYGQRLVTRERNVGADAQHAQTATALLLAAARGGAQAAGRPIGALAPGRRADFVVLDPNHLALQGLSAPEMLSAHVFASHRTSAIDSVVVGGHTRVANGRHRLHDETATGFVAARRELLAEP